MSQPPRNSTNPSWPDLSAALALLAAPALDRWLGPLAILVLVGLLAARRPPRRFLRIVGPGAGLAAVALAAGMLFGSPSADSERLVERAQAAFQSIWSDLDGAADRAVAAFSSEPPVGFDSPASFGILTGRIDREKGDRLTLLLLDPGGRVTAWAGHGLLHDLEGRELPGEGSELISSFSAATLVSVRSLEGDSSGWRVAAGRSLPLDRLPVRTRGPAAERHPAWVALPERAPAPPGFAVVAPAGRPRVAVALAGPDRLHPATAEGAGVASRAAWLILALTLALLAAGGDVAGRFPLWLGAAAGALAALGVSGGLVTVTALVATAAALAWTRAPAPSPRWLAVFAGGLSGPLVTLLVFLGQSRLGSMDLGSDLWPAPTALVLRLALFGFVLGLLSLGRRAGTEEAGAPVGLFWLAFLASGVAAAQHERVIVCLLLLAMAGVSTVLWIRRDRDRGTLRSAAGICILTALIAAVGWECAYRAGQRRQAAGPLLEAMGPPTATELVAISSAIERHFTNVELESMAPAGPAGLDSQDLAYEIWRSSPLARGGVLSAVSVSLPDGERATFSFGIPTTGEGRVDWSPARWDTLGLPVWDSFVMAGEEPLRYSGGTWGVVRYWQLLRPGFRLDEPIRRDLAARLLRGGPEASTPGSGLPGPTLYALYAPSGGTRISPWKTAPRIGAELRPSGRGVMATPDGPAWVFTDTGDDGLRALFLLRLPPIAALERVGAHALGLLLFVGGLALVRWLFGSRPVDLFGSLRLALRSYSKRLLLVYSVLALVPMLLVNLVFLRVTSDRLQSEQLAEGTAALESAQRVLGEYLLSLEPGFGIDSALDDELLGWLSDVVRHEVNLYWQSSVWASSRPELFTADLLPARIPGEIHSRLSRGDELSARTNRTGDLEYLELYAPLRVPGMPVEEAVRLVVSTPLLAQQEELAADLASLRLRSLLATTFLLLLLAGLGSRLARSFSDPLMQVVQGTQRIAEGGTSLGLAPTEMELATLVGAIDRMAERIADGRADLLREKRMVESMVENVTSGVVSVDAAGRVMLRNRVASDLLGVEVGDSLESALAGRRELAPVREAIRDAGQGVQRRTVQLVAGEDDEREWSFIWVPLPGSGEPAALLVVEDVTEVLRGQRLEAWAEMARIIAHEIKNPLTPIRLSTEHMLEVHERDPEHFQAVFESCTRNILKQVGELQQISSEFSTYSRIPTIDLSEGDLVAMVRDVVDGYRSGPEGGVTVLFRSESDALEAQFDARLLGRAVRNLIENSLRASPEGGTVEVSVAAVDGKAVIAVADHGPGVSPELLARIFDPYFSTHDSGTGLGLPIARRISEEHGGSIAARNRVGGGLRVEIGLPLHS